MPNFWRSVLSNDIFTSSMTLKIDFAQYLRNITMFQGLTRFYQNGQYRVYSGNPVSKLESKRV